jgi:RNA polymerase sigma-70 factor (ECF subfamily)
MPEDVHSIVAELPALRRYALSLTRERSRTDDLVQDAVARSVEKFHLYQPDTSLRSWLFAVMLNVFRDQQRQRKKQAAVAIELYEFGPRHTAPMQLEHLVHRDLLDQLETLKPHDRELLLMVAADGISYEQAAARSALPLGTVRSRLFRARSLLLRKLEGSADLRATPPAGPRGSALA